MGVWMSMECDGNRRGQRCQGSFALRTEDRDDLHAATLDWRPLSTVLSPETHHVLPDDHLCPAAGHDEEIPGYGYTRHPEEN